MESILPFPTAWTSLTPQEPTAPDPAQRTTRQDPGEPTGGDSGTLADGSGGGGQGGTPPGPPCNDNFIWIMVAVMAVFLFMSSRTQKKQKKERDAMLGAISKGDDVVLSSGIYGKVQKVDDLTLRVEIANNVAVKVDKNSVAKVGGKEAAGGDAPQQK